MLAAVLYVYTCTGTIVQIDGKTGKAGGHWEVSRLLPGELAIPVRDGCLLNNLAYDSHAKKLLAVIPKEPRVDEQSKRHHQVAGFSLPPLKFTGALDIPIETAAVPEIGPLGHVEFEVSADERYEMEADFSRQPPRWLGDARKRVAETGGLDPVHQMAAKLSQGQHLARVGLDGKRILVQEKSGKVTVHDGVTGKALGEGVAPGGARFVCLAPGGKMALYLVNNRLQVVAVPGKGVRAVFPDVELDASASCLAPQ